MIDLSAARAIAEEHLRAFEAGGSPPLALMDEHTREEDFGWVFFYNSARFLETRALRDALAGNGPLVVDRETGHVTTLPSALPVEESIRLHRDAQKR